MRNKNHLVLAIGIVYLHFGFEPHAVAQAERASSIAKAYLEQFERGNTFGGQSLQKFVDEYAARIFLKQSVPTFSTMTEKLALLSNLIIRDELGFPAEKLKEFEIFQREIRQQPSGSAGSRIKQENISKFLSATQLERLEQLVFHVDIAYRGLDQSLIEGKLGKSLDLYENQKSELFEKATGIVNAAERQILEIKKNVYTQSLKLLDEQQQRTASELLGPYFEYSDVTLEGRRLYVLASERTLPAERDQAIITNSREKNRVLMTVPHFNLDSEVLSLLRNRWVRDELGLTPAQYAAFKILNDKLNAPGKPRPIPGADLVADEILLPRQMARLKQITYYVEIAYLGLDKAITAGNLAWKVGVMESQIPMLSVDVKRFVEVAQSQIRDIRVSTQEKVLLELSSEQRAHARQLLGNYFEYRDPSVLASKAIYMDLLEYEVERNVAAQ